MVDGIRTAFIEHFPNQWPSNSLQLLPDIPPFIHRRRCQPCKATASSSGAVRLRSLAQGHFDTPTLGGSRGSNWLCMLSHYRPRRHYNYNFITATHAKLPICVCGWAAPQWILKAHSPPPCWMKYCSMLSQSILVRQKMMAWSILCSLMALMVYSPFSTLMASDQASRKRKK